ncbi:sulfotransferase family protein [Aurantiacibacter poecillastricola]|uniref:sulfotransferase family protein n=1 Tax=Aurantiacibacter poecillastricola TaxID=3064385 RepID=UPI00273FA5EC|nr:sulfotransferase [Aurantiacibacter sp. 219JJ12-13]MDP5261235.1 sulfotransferase [Aurantiacibacter sp. 219JJ12-13]
MTTPPQRTRLVDAVESLTRLAMRAGIMEPATFDKQAIMDAAAQRAGCEDFGDPWFEKPFEILLRSLEDEARLHEAGAWVAMKQCEKVLVDRLWAQQWFAEHPEILARPLRKPVFVIGPMRSGTTRLHRLLSADQRFNHVRSFETISPVPRPGFTHDGHDQRIDMARRVRHVAKLANPNTLAIHPTGPKKPEEELGLFVNSFWGMKHEAQWYVPGYGRWCEAQNAIPAYEQMARLLRLVGWSQQASSLKPWVLKTPQHMLDLDALLAVFPDARFIFTHRDPLRVVASSASLAWNQTCIYSNHANPRDVGQEWLRKTRLQVERMQEGRTAIAADRMIDVHYEDVDADWRGAMERIYDFLDLDITHAWPAMEAYCEEASALKRRPHRYSLAEFGLTEEDVMGELGAYARTFDVAREGRQAVL